MSEVKYIHYYPKCLLKNWGRFTNKYDFTTMAFSKHGSNISKVASYKLPNYDQKEMWTKKENDWNEKFKYNGKPLEDEVAKWMKFINLDYKEVVDKIRRIPKDLIFKFIEMLLYKSPATRGGVHLSTTKYNLEGDRVYDDSTAIILEEIVGSDRNVEDVMDIVKRGEYVIVCSRVPLPFIDPGYNILNIEHSTSLILQLSPYYYCIWTDKKIAEDIVEKWTGSKIEFIANKIMDFMIHGNSLLKYIYFNENSYSAMRDIKHFTNELQKRYDQIDSKKICTLISNMETDKEWWHIWLELGTLTLPLRLFANPDTSFGKAVVKNPKFSSLFKGAVVKNEIMSTKLREFNNKIIIINNQEVYLIDKYINWI